MSQSDALRGGSNVWDVGLRGDRNCLVAFLMTAGLRWGAAETREQTAQCSPELPRWDARAQFLSQSGSPRIGARLPAESSCRNSILRAAS